MESSRSRAVVRETYAPWLCPGKGFVESSSDYDWHRRSCRNRFFHRNNLAVGQTHDEYRNRRVLRNPLWHSNLCDRLPLVHRQGSSCGIPPSLITTLLVVPSGHEKTERYARDHEAYKRRIEPSQSGAERATPG